MVHIWSQYFKLLNLNFISVIHDQKDDNEDVICDFVKPRKSGRSISRDSSVFPHTCINEKLLRQRSQHLQGVSNETGIFEMTTLFPPPPHPPKHQNQFFNWTKSIFSIYFNFWNQDILEIASFRTPGQCVLNFLAVTTGQFLKRNSETPTGHNYKIKKYKQHDFKY